MTVDALFAHAGVIRTDTLGELFDVAALLARQPLPARRPRGDRDQRRRARDPLRRRVRGGGLRVEPLSPPRASTLAAGLRGRRLDRATRST